MTRVLVLLAALLVSCAAPVAKPSHRVGAGSRASSLETMSLAATVRSTPQSVAGYSTVGFAVRTTGTASGSWTVQYSNDYQSGVDDPTSDAKWDTYTLSSNPPDAAGSAQTFGVRLGSFEFAWARIKFASTGGTGSATIVTQLKGN